MFIFSIINIILCEAEYRIIMTSHYNSGWVGKSKYLKISLMWQKTHNMLNDQVTFNIAKTVLNGSLFVFLKRAGKPIFNLFLNSYTIF